MTWIELKIDGIKLRIDSINWTLIQMWRDGRGKPDDWFECKIYDKNKTDTIKVEGNSYSIPKIVYKAHNPNWSHHYSRHNILICKNGDTKDYSIENLMIKPTKR